MGTRTPKAVRAAAGYAAIIKARPVTQKRLALGGYPLALLLARLFP